MYDVSTFHKSLNSKTKLTQTEYSASIKILESQYRTKEYIEIRDKIIPEALFDETIPESDRKLNFINCHFNNGAFIGQFLATHLSFTNCTFEKKGVEFGTLEKVVPNKLISFLNCDELTLRINTDCDQVYLKNCLFKLITFNKINCNKIHISDSVIFQTLTLSELSKPYFFSEETYYGHVDVKGGAYNNFDLRLNNFFKLNTEKTEFREVNRIRFIGKIQVEEAIHINTTASVEQKYTQINPLLFIDAGMTEFYNFLCNDINEALINSIELSLEHGFSCPIFNLFHTTSNKFKISGINSHTRFKLFTVAIGNFEFIDFVNDGFLEFSKIYYPEYSNTSLNIESSNMGKGSIVGWAMNLWDFTYSASTLNELKYFSSVLPEISTEKSAIKDSATLYEAARQLRLLAEANNDHFQAVEQKALEAKYYWKSNVKTKTGDGAIRCISWINNFGLSWKRPIWFILLNTILFALIVAWLEDCYLVHGPNCSAPILLEAAKYILLVPNFANINSHFSDVLVLLIGLGKFINSILIFQMITGFRKYFRK